MSNPTSARSSHTTFRNKFEFEKRHFSYADNCEVIKNSPNMAASRSKEEIVRHMSNLPSYLERGKVTQDRALNFGVMDWGRLENWQFRNLKRVSVKSNKCSPSSSNYSSFFPTDESSPQSSRGQSCSPAPQKSHRATLQSHFDIKETFPENSDRFQDFEDAPIHRFTEKKTGNRSETGPSDCKIYKFYQPNNQETESKSYLKGKMKIPDESINELGKFQDSSYRTHLERHKTGVVLPRNCHQNSETNAKKSDPSRNSSRSTVPSKNSDLNMGPIAANKQRSMSPIRRFSFSVSSKFRAESPPVSQKPTRDNSCISNRAHSSPLRRLLEPLFTSKATNSRQSTEMSREDSKTKSKPDSRIRTEVRTDNESPSTKQALFQTTFKNGRPLFTFSVKNNDIIAATVRKDNINSWIYKFFTVQEAKKKNGNWLSPGSKGKGHGYVPNVSAQMKVSSLPINNNTQEFVLFSVNPSRVDSQMSNVHPHDELAAIVVKFSRNVDDEEANRERFSTTVILPGGNHGVSSKGEPSPLIERWLSGGTCDCGGWDLGCRLRTLTSQVPSRRSKLTKVHTINGQFELFFQGEIVNDKPLFSLCPLKEGTFSVEYDPSLSVLQAFSICISVVECRNSCQHTEARTYIAKQAEDDRNRVSFAGFPPVSPVGRV